MLSSFAIIFVSHVAAANAVVFSLSSRILSSRLWGMRPSNRRLSFSISHCYGALCQGHTADRMTSGRGGDHEDHVVRRLGT